ncbi:MAG: hypothetical protein DRQ97_12785 [Gammaproteobacteria bacterium]|nr:MAG: hypothetical protein DRQ97_12785 [Gammaproteobacteria bacterium]
MKPLTKRSLKPGNWCLGAICLLALVGQAEAYTVYSQKKGLGKANGSTPEDLALAKARVEAVNWGSVTGRVYSVDWTDDLTAGFTNIQDNLAYPANSYTDDVERVNNQNFYRISVLLR